MKCITILILLFFFMPSSLCAEIIGTKEDELFHRIIVNLNNECEDCKVLRQREWVGRGRRPQWKRMAKR